MPKDFPMEKGSRNQSVKNRVVVNSHSRDEAIRKGLSYFRYTSRDNYAISGVREISPGKWQVEALMRNPTSADRTKYKFKPTNHISDDQEVREPYTSDTKELDNV